MSVKIVRPSDLEMDSGNDTNSRLEILSGDVIILSRWKETHRKGCCQDKIIVG